MTYIYNYKYVLNIQNINIQNWYAEYSFVFFSYLTFPHEQFHMPLKIDFDDCIKGWIIIYQLFPPFDVFMFPISAFIDKAEINNLEFEAFIVSLIESPWQIPGSGLEYSQGSHTCYLITVHKNAGLWSHSVHMRRHPSPESTPPNSYTQRLEMS